MLPTRPTALALFSLLGLASCDPGPTIYLGRPTHAQDAATGEDASDASDDDDDDDDNRMACTTDAMCSRKRAYCSPIRALCVRCLVDSHCDSDEYCTERGKCEDD